MLELWDHFIKSQLVKMLSLQEGMVSFLFRLETSIFRSHLRYCGEMCQKADWESHWQWCQQKVEARSKKEKNKGKVNESDSGQPIEEMYRVSHERKPGWSLKGF